MNTAHANAGPVDPVLSQAVRGDLHRHRAHALVRHPREQPLQVRRLGRRAVERHGAPVDAHAGRPDHAGREPGGAEHRLQEVGRRRLPVRAGDADQRHALGRPAEERRGDRPHRPPHRRDDDLRAADRRPAVRPRPRRRRPPGRGRERRARRRASPGHAEEQRARGGPRRTGSVDVGDRRVAGTVVASTRRPGSGVDEPARAATSAPVRATMRWCVTDGGSVGGCRGRAPGTRLRGPERGESSMARFTLARS